MCVCVFCSICLEALLFWSVVCSIPPHNFFLAFSRRSHILALINVIAGIQANWFQYRAIAAKFFENARSLISSRAVSFPISIRLLEILELRALSWTNKKGSKAKLEALLNSVKVEGNSKVQTAIEQTLAQIDNQGLEFYCLFVLKRKAQVFG